MGFERFDRAALVRGVPIVASVALHVALFGVVATGVPRASARILDAIPVELVTVDAPRVAESPPARSKPMAPPAPLSPPKVITPLKPIARPLPTPVPVDPSARETAATPPAREPAPTPVMQPAPTPAVSTSTAAPTAPSVTTPSMTPSENATTAPLAPGVSLVESAPATKSTPSSAVASIPPGVTRVAHPRGGYQVQPRYPSTAHRRGIQGTTLLRVHVLANGKIGEIEVEESAGHPDLDQAAAVAVRRWQFEPARRGEEAVAMWVLLPVEFRLK